MSFDSQNNQSRGEERRHASRFGRLPDDDFAAIWVGNEEPELAEVHDESLGGISLILSTDCGIGIGSQAHIVYAGVCHLAQAVHVESFNEQQVLIGFQCEAMPEATMPR